MVPDFVPEILAEGGAAFAAGEPGEQRTEQAVILIGRDVERLVVDSDGIPAIEQVAKLIRQRSQVFGLGASSVTADVISRAGQAGRRNGLPDDPVVRPLTELFADVGQPSRASGWKQVRKRKWDVSLLGAMTRWVSDHLGQLHRSRACDHGHRDRGKLFE